MGSMFKKQNKTTTTTTNQNSSTLFFRVLISIVSGHFIQRETKSRSLVARGCSEGERGREISRIQNPIQNILIGFQVLGNLG